MAMFDTTLEDLNEITCKQHNTQYTWFTHSINICWTSGMTQEQFLCWTFRGEETVRGLSSQSLHVYAYFLKKLVFSPGWCG